MSSPNDRRYAPTHEWHKLQDGLVAVGISRFAVAELTDITYLQIKRKTGPIRAGESFGEIESVKATSELYCGIDGEVVAVNPAPLEDPALVNEDPYERGWMIKVRPADAGQLQHLLSAEDYDRQHA